MFVMLLNSIERTSKHTKCVLLSHQKCVTQPTLINFYPNNNNLVEYMFQIKQEI